MSEAVEMPTADFGRFLSKFSRISEQSSPFRRWTTGGGSGSSYRHTDHRALFNKQMSEGAEEGTSSGSRGQWPNGGVARWALGLNHLLADPIGVAAFTAFLKKEFASENIKFYLSCETYSRTEDLEKRAILAREIWERHLSDGAPESVNIDSGARRATMSRVGDAPPPELFAQDEAGSTHRNFRELFNRFCRRFTCTVSGRFRRVIRSEPVDRNANDGEMVEMTCSENIDQSSERNNSTERKLKESEEEEDKIYEEVDTSRWTRGRSRIINVPEDENSIYEEVDTTKWTKRARQTRVQVEVETEKHHKEIVASTSTRGASQRTLQIENKTENVYKDIDVDRQTGGCQKRQLRIFDVTKTVMNWPRGTRRRTFLIEGKTEHIYEEIDMGTIKKLYRKQLLGPIDEMKIWSRGDPTQKLQQPVMSEKLYEEQVENRCPKCEVPRRISQEVDEALGPNLGSKSDDYKLDMSVDMSPRISQPGDEARSLDPGSNSDGYEEPRKYSLVVDMSVDVSTRRGQAGDEARSLDPGSNSGGYEVPFICPFMSFDMRRRRVARDEARRLDSDGYEEPRKYPLELVPADVIPQYPSLRRPRLPPSHPRTYFQFLRQLYIRTYKAQRQVFNVMRLDPYPRFLRSTVHAECARADLLGQPSPYQETSFTTNSTGQTSSSRLKKSASNASERRRSGGSSLLPWRLRVPSRERAVPGPAVPPVAPAAVSPAVSTAVAAQPEPESNHPPAAVPGQSNSGPGDSAVPITDFVKSGGFCRVQLPDGATSVGEVKRTISVGDLVGRMLVRHNLLAANYDVIFKDARPGEPSVIDLHTPSTILGGREVAVERRCVVRMEVAGRCVAVRCRPERRLRHVLRPVLARYAPASSASAPRAVLRDDCVLHPDTTMQDLDDARLQIVELCGTAAECAREDDADSLSDLAVRLQDEHRNDDQSNSAQVDASTPSRVLAASASAAASAALGSSSGRVRAALRAGPPLHHHPPDFLENLRETQRQRLQIRNDPASPRTPPPLPPKPRAPTLV